MSASQANDLNVSPDTAVFCLLPAADALFAQRAARFATLAEGHPLSDWLTFLGRLSAAQHEAAQALAAADPPLPAERLAQAQKHGMPPLNAADWPRPPAWRAALRQIAGSLRSDAPGPAQAALDDLLAASDEALEALATTLLAGEPQAPQAAVLPYVGAALQVLFTSLAARLDASRIAAPDPAGAMLGVCPCCGSPPVSSPIRIDTAIGNLRYLHCALCNSEWNVPRAVCSVCATDGKLTYRQIEGHSDGIRGECCDNCHSYLKLLLHEKNFAFDPVADDLASLALDLLLDEAGYSRSGFNCFLVGGA